MNQSISSSASIQYSVNFIRSPLAQTTLSKPAGHLPVMISNKNKIGSIEFFYFFSFLVKALVRHAESLTTGLPNISQVCLTELSNPNNVLEMEACIYQRQPCQWLLWWVDVLITNAILLQSNNRSQNLPWERWPSVTEAPTYDCLRGQCHIFC